MTNSQSPPSPAPLADNASKRKRRPAGTPDPDAEVVALSPRTLLESDRYVCEICNQGFQREQNLQMHRRRHKVPWKLLKRDAGAGEARKRVFVCPEPSCLHHDPCHALGDLVGIKKHFRRKHSTNRQWVCEKCSKAYAVQSDYKAHLKTCGTRGHSCDCGRVFSRVESFIEHQDACNANRAQTPSSPSPSSDTNFSAVAWTPRMLPSFTTVFLHSEVTPMPNPTPQMELQLLPASGIHATTVPSFSSATISPISEEAHFTKLELSVGSGLGSARDPEKIREEAKEQLRLAAADKAVADEARMQARRMMEIAEQEFANAKRIRMQAQAELNRMHVMRDHATKKIKSTMMEITCQSCKQLFRGKPTVMASEVNSLAASYMSSVTEGEGEYDDDDRHHQTMACNT